MCVLLHEQLGHLKSELFCVIALFTRLFWHTLRRKIEVQERKNENRIAEQVPFLFAKNQTLGKTVANQGNLV